MVYSSSMKIFGISYVYCSGEIFGTRTIPPYEERARERPQAQLWALCRPSRCAARRAKMPHQLHSAVHVQTALRRSLFRLRFGILAANLCTTKPHQLCALLCAFLLILGYIPGSCLLMISIWWKITQRASG